jgi:hypothetical protein
MNNSNTNYDNITKALIYKQSNPPLYHLHRIRSESCIADTVSKACMLRFNVHGKLRITQCFTYGINNEIIKYRCYYYSEEQRKKDMKKNKKNWKKDKDKDKDKNK